MKRTIESLLKPCRSSYHDTTRVTLISKGKQRIGRALRIVTDSVGGLTVILAQDLQEAGNFP